MVVLLHQQLKICFETNMYLKLMHLDNHNTLQCMQISITTWHRMQTLCGGMCVINSQWCACQQEKTMTFKTSDIAHTQWN